MSIINRAAAEALIEEQLIRSVQQGAPTKSIFMQLARRLPNMTSKTTRMPVLDMLPTAYWVNGDTGFKQTSEQAWDNVYMTAAELAVIVPIPEAVIADASFDIIGEVQPRILEAFDRAVDQAIIFGVNKPGEWGADLITRARQAGNNVAPGSSFGYDTLLGTSGVIAKVEAGGYLPNGGVADLAMRAKLRGIKNSDGTPLYTTSMQGSTQYALDGFPLYFPTNGAFDNGVAQLIVGDWSQAVYSIRQDVTVKLLDQGVIQDPTTKSILYNLAQQDMVAIRAVFRMGWALPNPASAIDGDRTKCPFAYLEPATAAATYTFTVTVKDNATQPAVISGAMVDVEGARIKTGSAGTAVFNLRPGTYNYKVTKAGMKPVIGTTTIESAAATADVTLVSA